MVTFDRLFRPYRGKELLVSKDMNPIEGFFSVEQKGALTNFVARYRADANKVEEVMYIAEIVFMYILSCQSNLVYIEMQNVHFPVNFFFYKVHGLYFYYSNFY